MNDINDIIAKNLIKFRLANNLTQAQLAEKIKYSDKSISKWERAEGLPDVNVLYELSKLYGVTLNDFVTENNYKPKLPLKQTMVAIVSSTIAWIVACVCFIVLYLIDATKTNAWLSFIFAIPTSSIVLLVFSKKFKNILATMFSTSLLLWGIIISVCLLVKSTSLWLTFSISGGILQIIIVLWFLLKKLNKK